MPGPVRIEPQQRGQVGAERDRVKAQHDEVAQPQQQIERARDAGAERPVQEGGRPAAAADPHRQQRVRPAGQGRHDPGDHERQVRAPAGELHRQPQHREDAAADHAADPDRHQRSQAQTPRGRLPVVHPEHTPATDPTVSGRGPRAAGRQPLPPARSECLNWKNPPPRWPDHAPDQPASATVGAQPHRVAGVRFRPCCCSPRRQRLLSESITRRSVRGQRPQCKALLPASIRRSGAEHRLCSGDAA